MHRDDAGTTSSFALSKSIPRIQAVGLGISPPLEQMGKI
jgi:hypothetical protein